MPAGNSAHSSIIKSIGIMLHGHLLCNQLYTCPAVLSLIQLAPACPYMHSPGLVSRVQYHLQGLHFPHAASHKLFPVMVASLSSSMFPLNLPITHWASNTQVWAVQVNGLDPSWNSQATADKLAAWLLDLYAALQAAFPPSRQSHYSLTPRHLSVWAAELQRYSLHGTNLLQVQTVHSVSTSTKNHSTLSTIG